MDKITYLAELAEGLARWVPERERQDILRYYAEYFEEAGPEREAEVVAELGDPWALSCRLAVEGGFVTQEKADAWTPRQNKRKVWPLVVVGSVAAAAIVGISVASFAAQVGRFVGRAVGAVDNSIQGVLVTDEWTAAEAAPVTPNVYMYESVPSENPISFIEGEMIGKGGFWTMEDGCLEAFDTIDAEISFGNITITGGTDYTLFIDQSANLSGYSVQWEVKDGVLKLRDGMAFKQAGINNWDDLKNLLSGNMNTLDVVITVPDGFELGKISATTNMGDIFLSELYVDKRVEAGTSMGDVECYEVRTANKISLKTRMGDVTLGLGEELSGGMDIDLETSMGDVEASLGSYEYEWEYGVKTSMGEVTVNGADRGTKAERKGDYPYKLDAESSMGNVNVYFYTGQNG